MKRWFGIPIILGTLMATSCESSTPVVLLGSNPVSGCPAHTKAIASELRWGVALADRARFQQLNDGSLGLNYDEAGKLVHLFAFVTCSNGKTVIVRSS